MSSILTGNALNAHTGRSTQVQAALQRECHQKF